MNDASLPIVDGDLVRRNLRRVSVTGFYHRLELRRRFAVAFRRTEAKSRSYGRRDSAADRRLWTEKM